MFVARGEPRPGPMGAAPRNRMSERASVPGIRARMTFLAPNRVDLHGSALGRGISVGSC
jgi:hypothetical protein